MAESNKRAGVLARSSTRLMDLFQYQIWESDPRSLLGFPYRFLRILYLSARGFRKDHCQLMAASLTYITLLSIVPLLAFAFSVSKGLHAQNVWLRDWVENELSGALQEVAREILARVEQIDVAALGAIGFAILLAVVLKMVGTVERSFNVIWGVRRARSLLRKITDYVSMVVLGPIFLITIVGVTTVLASNSVVESILKTPVVGELRTLRHLAPFVVVWIGFTFLYLFLPNTRVRIPAALLAGVTAGTLWELCLKFYIWSQVGVSRYTALYGAFAAIPIFLIWVDLSWVIVLVGGELCFAIQNEGTYLQEVQSRKASREDREALALHLMARIARRFADGQRGCTASAISESLQAPVRLVNEIAGQLVDGGCLQETRGEDPILVPARDPRRIEIRTILDILSQGGGEGRGGASGPAGRGASPRNRDAATPVQELLERLRRARDDEIGSLDLAQLADRLPPQRARREPLRNPSPPASPPSPSASEPPSA